MSCFRYVWTNVWKNFSNFLPLKSFETKLSYAKVSNENWALETDKISKKNTYWYWWNVVLTERLITMRWKNDRSARIQKKKKLFSSFFPTSMESVSIYRLIICSTGKSHLSLKTIFKIQESNDEFSFLLHNHSFHQ